MLANTQSEAIAMMDTLQTLNQPIFLEELHKEDLLQVFVVRNDVIATLKRKTSEAEYEKYEISKPSRAVVRVALNVCRILKTSFARIDILGTQEPVIVDVDICPLLSKIKDKDVGDKVFKKIKALAEVEKGGIIVKFIEDVKMVLRDIIRG